MAKEGGNPQNLKPFQKGYDERRDGSGRKPGKTFATILESWLDGERDFDFEGMNVRVTRREALALEALKLAHNSKDETRLAAIREIFDRLEGKPTQKTEVAGTVNVTPTVGTMSEEKFNALLRLIESGKSDAD